MGRNRSLSSSSFESSSNQYSYSTRRDLSTDLRLGLSFGSGPSSSAAARHQLPVYVGGEEGYFEAEDQQEENECNSVASFFVKVTMEGVPIGRKTDLLALDGYHDLIRTLDHMFNTSILWAEEEEMYNERTHVLTYADKEGDWMMVGDVPWEMFLSTVRRLKISRAYNS